MQYQQNANAGWLPRNAVASRNAEQNNKNENAAEAMQNRQQMNKHKR